MTPSHAAGFARIALDHVTRDYPHKPDHVMSDDGEAYSPRRVHPIFFGSFDWHSCVHGYWLLARIRRRRSPSCNAQRVGFYGGEPRTRDG
ncbi:DUF2891 family protein [Brevundimonas sp. TSRC1-1]|uniref:DUF2891 family protein n=1 Tax=Brevundimonas sp. TSRC1-1 TaxID=2804562 RepID=UPI003CF0E7D8